MQTHTLNYQTSKDESVVHFSLPFLGNVNMQTHIQASVSVFQKGVRRECVCVGGGASTTTLIWGLTVKSNTGSEQSALLPGLLLIIITAHSLFIVTSVVQEVEDAPLGGFSPPRWLVLPADPLRRRVHSSHRRPLLHHLTVKHKENLSQNTVQLCDNRTVTFIIIVQI